MELVRDVLDNQLVDRHGTYMGKVDGLILVIDEGQPPRVAHITCGISVLAPRLHEKVGRPIARILARLKLARRKPMRIPWTKVRDVGVDIEIDVDACRTSAMSWEKWLNKHIIARIPGSG
jgi:sporulation protein YlmC with PRC-barrel domain